MKYGVRSSVGDARVIDILGRLRLDTRAEHAAIERCLGLFDDALTVSGYVRIIERFYGFWQPLEGALRQVTGLATLGFDLTEREKTPLLLSDLRALTAREPAELALCSALPDVTRVSAALGCLYVVEGSTLGGQVITRHIRTQLEIEVDTGGRFFNGYGSETGAMWRVFSARLGALTLTPYDQAVVVDTANATFRLLREWLELPDASVAAEALLGG